MSGKRAVYQLTEVLLVVIEHCGTFFKGQTLRTVAAVIRYMTGGLVRQQVDGNMMVYCVLKEVNNVAMECDGHRLLFIHIGTCEPEGFFRGFCDKLYPALAVSGLDTGGIHFSNDTDTTGDLDRLWLCAAHSAKAACNE